MTPCTMHRSGSALAIVMGLMGGGALAQCGNAAKGFDAWKSSFATQAKRAGVKAGGLDALGQAQYTTRTIAADRNQKSFRHSRPKFMHIRGADTIATQGRKRKARRPRASIRRTRRRADRHSRHGNGPG